MAKSRDSVRKLFLDMGFYDILTFAKLFVHHYRRVGWRSHCNIFQKGLNKNSFHLRAASNRPLRAIGQNSSAHMTRGVAAIWPLLLFTFVYWTRPALIMHFFIAFTFWYWSFWYVFLDIFPRAAAWSQLRICETFSSRISSIKPKTPARKKTLRNKNIQF